MEDHTQQPRPPLPDRVDTLSEGKSRENSHAHTALLARVRGTLLGAALGDALGLQVDGDNVLDISDHHPNGPDYPYRGAYGGYPGGDWTDATDMAILTARTLSAHFKKENNDPILDLASRISRWNKQGFPELGDHSGIRPESVVLRAVSARDFITRPLDVACEIKGYKAENGAMTRSIACAFTPYPSEWAETLSKVTHSDPRALACAVSFTLLIRAIAELPIGSVLPAELIRGPIAGGCAMLDESPRRIDFMARLTDTATLETIALDERELRSYAVKTLSCAMWALRQIIRTPVASRGPNLFKKVLSEVASHGGDASSNCCAVGAILGTILGADDLPQDWLVALPNRDWLEREISGFQTATESVWSDNNTNAT